MLKIDPSRRRRTSSLLGKMRIRTTRGPPQQRNFGGGADRVGIVASADLRHLQQDGTRDAPVSRRISCQSARRRGGRLGASKRAPRAPRRLLERRSLGLGAPQRLLAAPRAVLRRIL